MKRQSAEKRRGQRTHRKQIAQRVARDVSKAQGCDCKPDVTGGPGHVVVAHDLSCPLANAGRVPVLYWQKGRAS